MRKGLRESSSKNSPIFSWITAGGRGFIGLASENACAYVIITKDQVFLATNNVESVRLFAEELPEGLALPITLNWETDGTMNRVLHEKFSNLSDDSEQDVWFRESRTVLNEDEILRYTQLGKTTAEVLENVCLNIQPGMSEFEVAGKISDGLWSAGIEPITLLIAADSRSERVRHYVPTNQTIHTGVICSLCARKYGLIVSATRIVAFDNSFAKNYYNLLRVEQKAFESTARGGTLGDILQEIFNAYDSYELAGEWKSHHQGGITGYLAREIRADRSCPRKTALNQAFAWNPSAKGAKCEDTVILTEQGIQVLTCSTDKWPTIKQGGLTRPDVLKKY